MDDFITLAIIVFLVMFIICVIYNKYKPEQKKKYNTKEKSNNAFYNSSDSQGFQYNSTRSRFVKEGAEERIRRRMNN